MSEELSPEAKKFLASLDESSISALETMVRTFVMFSNWCRITKWLFLGFLFLLFSLSQGIDAIKNVLGMKSH